MTWGLRRLDHNADKIYTDLYGRGYGVGRVRSVLDWCYKNGAAPCQHEPILDVGCGRTELARLLTEGNPHISVWGVDIAHYFQRDQGDNHCPVKRCDITEKIPFDDDYFGCTWCIDVMEHIAEDKVQSTLREIRRVLEPNGLWIFLIDTGPSRWTDSSGGNLHITQKDAEWWVKELEVAGFGPDDGKWFRPGTPLRIFGTR